MLFCCSQLPQQLSGNLHKDHFKTVTYVRRDKLQF